MTEKNPLRYLLTDLENGIIDLDNGTQALSTAAYAALENDPEINVPVLLFLGKGLRAVHDDLRAKFDALASAAYGRSQDD